MQKLKDKFKIKTVEVTNSWSMSRATLVSVYLMVMVRVRARLMHPDKEGTKEDFQNIQVHSQITYSYWCTNDVSD